MMLILIAIMDGMNTTPNDHAITLYGIPNCDTVKKARAWLTERGGTHAFHDFKKQGVPKAVLDAALQQVGWELLLNRKGTAWRLLDPAAQTSVVDNASAKAIMCSHPSTIKRPVVAWADGRITVGFEALRQAHDARE